MWYTRPRIPSSNVRLPSSSLLRNSPDIKTPRPAVDTTKAYSEYVVRWMNDMRRSVDYLDSRGVDKLVYYGFSWEGRLESIALALERRFDLGALLDGGFPKTQPRPEVRETVFAPRVEVPVLMVNAKNGFDFPVETCQKPMFEMLGTTDEDKRHILFESGHGVLSYTRNQAIREILDWFDRHFGRAPS